MQQSQKENSEQPPTQSTSSQSLHTDVIAALQKLETTEDIDDLSLEEVMMCRYKLPCRRVSPVTSRHRRDPNRQFRKYGRGSILVYATEVVLILYPDDNTTRFACAFSRVIGPKRHYKGLLPGSSFYTTAGHHVYVEEPYDRVNSARKAFRQAEEYYREHPEERGLLVWTNAAGSLNDHRCSEAFALAGRKDAERFKRALLSSGAW